jgi:hypothetical protein
MTTQAGAARNPIWFLLWWWRRLAHRRQVELVAIDLHDRYGWAAYGIARNSRRSGVPNDRRFWRLVARRLWRLEMVGKLRLGRAPNF